MRGKRIIEITPKLLGEMLHERFGNAIPTDTTVFGILGQPIDHRGQITGIVVESENWDNNERESLEYYAPYVPPS